MNYTKLYADFIRKFLKLKSPLKVVFDCSNGAVGPVLKEVLKGNKKIKPIFINATPDGHFPAHSPNPLDKKSKLQTIKKVLSSKSDMGVIFDADGDRVVFIDNSGEEADPRYILALLSPLFKSPYLVNAAIGKETMRWLMPKTKFIEEVVGRYFIKRTAQRKKIGLSVEKSGHYFFGSFNYADSGILATVLVMSRVSALKSRRLNLSSWIQKLPALYSTGEVNVKVKNPKKLLSVLRKVFKRRSSKINTKDGITITDKNFWLNARASNTEPVVRVSLATKDKKLFDLELSKLRKLYN